MKKNGALITWTLTIPSKSAVAASGVNVTDHIDLQRPFLQLKRSFMLQLNKKGKCNLSITILREF